MIHKSSALFHQRFFIFYVMWTFTLVAPFAGYWNPMVTLMTLHYALLLLLNNCRLQKYLHFWNQCDLLVATCGLFGINLSLLSWPQLPMGNLVYSKQFDRGGSSSSQQTTLLTTRRRGHCSVYPLSALSRRMENDTGPLSFNAKESSEWQVRLFCDAQTLLL